MKIELQRILTTYAPDLKLLLATSGGLDSMTLLHLLHETDQPFEVAHCNFQLRGEESDGDQTLIEKTCEQLNIPLHVKTFDTDSFSKENKLGTQEAARELRYTWFNEVLSSRNLDLITTAHHADDQAETIVMNFLRGSGPAGLSGMQVLKGNRFRPLLSFKKQAIAEYASKHQIQFREDSSNQSKKYRRNHIRLDIIPSLTEINPNLVDTLASQGAIMQEIQDLTKATLPSLVESIDHSKTIDIEKLLSTSFPILILGEIFREDNLSREQLIEIRNLCDSQSGAYFESGSLRVSRDRDRLKYTRKETSIRQTETFASFEELAASRFKARILDPSEAKFAGPSEAWFDADKITYPLILRSWSEGDRFQPLGMSGTQKISDLLVQKKVALSDKSKVTVLCMGEDILWIPNLHSSEKGKLTENTLRVLHLSCR